MAGLAEFIGASLGLGIGLIILIKMMRDVSESAQKMKSYYEDVHHAQSPFAVMSGAERAIRALVYGVESAIATLASFIAGVVTAFVELTSALVSIALFFSPKPKAPKKAKTVSKTPPLRMQKFLHFALKPSEQEVILGDMEELFHTMGNKFGYTTARRWYIWQMVRTTAAVLFGKAMKWGVFAYLGDMIRRIIAP